MTEIMITFPVQMFSSNCLVPNNLRENYIHTQHKQNKAKTKSLKPKPLKTLNMRPILNELIIT